MSGFAAVLLALVAMFWPVGPHDRQGAPPVSLAWVRHAVSVRKADREDAIIVTLKPDGRVYFRQDRVLPQYLAAKIRSGAQEGAERRVYFNVDAGSRYGDLLPLVDSAREAGVSDITLLVESKPESPLP